MTLNVIYFYWFPSFQLETKLSSIYFIECLTFASLSSFDFVLEFLGKKVPTILRNLTSFATLFTF